MPLRIVLIMTLLTACAGQTSQASVLTYFGEDATPGGDPANLTNANAAHANFQSALSGVTTEDFESFSDGDTGPLTVNFGPTAAQLSGDLLISDTPYNGRFAVSGTNRLNAGPPQSLTLTFSAPQAAFGFYGTDIGDFNGQLALSFDGGANVNIPHTINAPNGSGLFFGYIDLNNTFTTVQFSGTGTDDYFGFDDFTIGTREQVLVPEPSSLAMFGIGALGPFGYGRRRRQISAA